MNDTHDPRALIEVNNLSKSYDQVEAVKDVSFSVGPGEIYGLLGPNGAGKSTTINIISGLLVPGAGDVRIAGVDIAVEPEAAKRQLGVVPQQSIVIEELSALENCMFFGSLYGMPKQELRARALELLDWIDLGDKKTSHAGTFSGGQLRRLTLVLGLLHEPRALVLDEPTVGLDPQTRLLMLEKVAEVARGGTAVLLSTHYLDEAERLCGRIGIIDHGRIITEGTLSELRAAVEDVQLFSLRGRFDRKPLLGFVQSLDGGRIVLDEEEELTISLPSASAHASALLEKAAAMEHVKEVAIRPPSLESLFISLTGRDLRE
jgi:ABC-2 type transport system ATP-binding protein